MKVAAFTKYDREAASTRQLVLQYLPHLAAAGIQVEVHPLLDDTYVRSLASGTAASKSAIAAAYSRRFRQLLGTQQADLIWVYAELFPWLPASFERLAFRSGKPVVYDYDDAFFHPYDEHANPLVRRVLGARDTSRQAPAPHRRSPSARAPPPPPRSLRGPPIARTNGSAGSPWSAP